MAASSEVTVKVETDSSAAAAAEEKLSQALVKKKLKVEAAAAAEKKRLADLAAKWKEPGPLKLPPLPGMKVCAVGVCYSHTVFKFRFADDVRHEQSPLITAHQRRHSVLDIPCGVHRRRAFAAWITGRCMSPAAPLRRLSVLCSARP
jgi:hypothetical protein